MIDADVMAIHLNYLQEVAQPEGDLRGGRLPGRDQGPGPRNCLAWSRRPGRGSRRMWRCD